MGVSSLHSEFTEDALLTDSQTNTNRLVPAGSHRSVRARNHGQRRRAVRHPARTWTLTPRVQVSYIDEQLATPFRYAATTVPSRTVTDVRLTAMPTDNLRLEAFATNVFDETYIAAQVQDASSATGGFLYGPPRQVGIRAKIRFLRASAA